jgi:hypothetical protein
MIRAIESERFSFREKLSENNAVLMESIRANAELRSKIEAEGRKQALFEKMIADLGEKLKLSENAK